MAAPRSSGFWNLALLFLALLLVGAGFVLGFAPIARCPQCPTEGSALPPARAGSFVPPGSKAGAPAASAIPFPTCLRCNGRGTVSYLNRWFVRNWEGKPVSVIISRGFRRTASASVWERTGIRMGVVLTRDLLEEAQLMALRSGSYESVKLDAFESPYSPGTVQVVMTVVER